MFFGGDPFEHFSGMHGGPGGPGGMRGPSKDVDTTKLYETLGVSVSVLDWADVEEKMPAPHARPRVQFAPAIVPTMPRIIGEMMRASAEPAQLCGFARRA
jgi:hypothetical protein